MGWSVPSVPVRICPHVEDPSESHVIPLGVHGIRRPSDPRQRVAQRAVNLVRVGLVSGIMGRLIRRFPSGPAIASTTSQSRSTDAPKSVTPGPMPTEVADTDFAISSYIFLEIQAFSFFLPTSHQFRDVFRGEARAPGRRVSSAGFQTWPFLLVAKSVVSDPVMPLGMRLHVDAGLVSG